MAQMPYGERVKKARLKQRPKPWTQYMLARESGVSEFEICRIERGKVQNPQDITRELLESALPDIKAA